MYVTLKIAIKLIFKYMIQSVVLITFTILCSHQHCVFNSEMFLSHKQKLCSC